MIPIPKHRHGDLFQNSSEDLDRAHCIACVGYNGGPYDTGQLASGYLAAAHQLILCEMDVRSHQIDKLPIEARTAVNVSIDLKAYPILYCYRHGIELGLKPLLLQLPRFFNQALTPDKLWGHPLEKWWNELLPHLERLRTEAVSLTPPNREEGPWWLEKLLQPGDLTNFGSIIIEVHGLDPSSTTFRYALDQGKIPLRDKKHIVLDKVLWFMLPVSVWFEEMFYHTDRLAGPTPGLEPKW